MMSHNRIAHLDLSEPEMTERCCGLESPRSVFAVSPEFLQCRGEQVVLRQRVIELGGNAEQPFRGRRPRDNRHFDRVFKAQPILERVRVER